MAYDGMYGDLSTRGTVNDILNQALVVQATVVPLADQVEQDAADVAIVADTLNDALPAISQAAEDAAQTVVLAAQVQTNATNAANSANSASSASTLSQQWATNPEDSPVVPGQFSAYHWAQKAQDAATGDLDAVYLRRDGNLGNLSSASAARTNLGLGTMSTQNAGAVAITGGTLSGASIVSGSISGLTSDLAISDGGTGASTASAARTNLGLGTAATQDSSTFQPVDATLTALAGLTTGANTLPYATGTDTFSQTTLTPFARTLLDDADAATARTTLGISSASNTQLKSWVNFNGSSGAITSHLNVGSVNRIAAGVYNINFITAMPDTTYGFTGAPVSSAFRTFHGTGTKSTTSCQVKTSGGDLQGQDSTEVYVAFFGN